MNDNIISFKDQKDKTIARYIEKGNKAIYNNHLKDALKWFEKAYELDPDNVNIIYNLAALHVEENNTDISEKLLLKAFEKDSNHLYTLIGLANIVYYKTGNFEMASHYLKLALKHQNDSPELLTAYGNLLMLEGKLKKATKFFEKAINIDETYIPAFYGISSVFNFTGLIFLSKHQFDQAIFSFKQSVTYNDEWIAPKLNLARTFGFLNRYKKAFEIIDSIKEMIGTDIDLDYLYKIKDTLDDDNQLMLPIMIKITEAKLLQQIGDRDSIAKAEELFYKIYSINDRFPTLNFSLALISLDKKEYKEAEKHIKNELIVSPNSIKVKTIRYIIYKKMKTPISWEIHFNLLKKLNEGKDEGNIYKLFTSGMILQRYGMFDESKDMLKYAESLNPAIFKELKDKDIESTLNAIYSNYSDRSLV